MRGGDLLDHAFTSRAELQENFAVVAGIVRAADQAMGLEPVDQLDRTVMPDQHSPGERADGRSFAARQALESEQQLILLRLEARLASRSSAEIQEAANGVAEVGDGRVIQSRWAVAGHGSIIS